MANVVKIENAEIQVKEYNGQRIVTFKDVDVVHERKSGTARKTFNRNKKRFVPNEDYFVLKTDEARKLFGVSAPNGLIALTEQGYLMLVKPFSDDLAWTVQRELVNAYFRAKAPRCPAEGFLLEDSDVLRNTSNAPIPKTPDWYARNMSRIRWMCSVRKKSIKSLYHFILSQIGKEYDLKAANRIYEKERGYSPEYPMDVVSYFTELANMADDILDSLEEKTREIEEKRDGV